ncbi:MAG: hypothetical protein AB1772_07225 [Candidatus Zixiibacteriota bacterium]
MKHPGNVLIIGLFLLGSHASSVAEALDPAQAIPLFLKIVSYDQSFQGGPDRTVTVYLPYDRREAPSYEQYRVAQRYFEKNADLTVLGSRIRFQPVCCDSLRTIVDQLSPDDYNIMMLTSLNEEQTRLLADLKSGTRIRTFAFDAVQIPFGVAVSVRPDEKKNAIIVNLAAAQSEGSRFGAQLLRLCEIWEGKS